MFFDNYPTRPPNRSYFVGTMGIPEEVLDDYYGSLLAHIAAVHDAGKKLGVPEQQLYLHDLSKFSVSEFGAYAKHFKGGGAPNEFAHAWIHHIHHNEHHWERWIFPNGFTPKDSEVENGAIEMPEHFALEMVADWMGASVAYTGSDDMTDWLKGNMGRITVHSRTAIFLRKILRELGYGGIVDYTQFRHEREATA